MNGKEGTKGKANQIKEVKAEEIENTIEKKDLYLYDEHFRDSIATVDERGKRIWIYPKKQDGRYLKRRSVVSILLLTLLFAGPFIQVGGRPFLLFNIFERKFIIFGAAFWPQDFYLLTITLITFFVFIILFTVTFGRIWCGWACPQTLFMEMVFRKIEYWIEGSANSQYKLDQGPWTGQKIFLKGAKHLIFIAISLLISHTVMAYLIGLNETIEIISQPPSKHLSGFMGLAFFTALFYWVFAYFREQACVVVCPYGRLQGVLLIKESIVVIYDWIRGEPRGKLNKQAAKSHVEKDKGDCIDCKLCIHVCPTGIDIRNGTQLECVNCTACIDACDEVMDKINKPKGLIRFSSFTAIDSGIKKIFTPRVIAYSVVLGALLVLLTYFLVTRSDIDATIHRVPGMSSLKTDDGKVGNLFNMQFLNKTFDAISLNVKMEEFPEASIEQVGNAKIDLPPGDNHNGVFMVKIPPEKLAPGKNPIVIGVYSGNDLLYELETNFMGPMPGKR